MEKRDPILFPADENGDVLWRMKCQGDDLAKIRELDFSVVFPTEEAALKFAIRFLKNGFKVDLQRYEDQPEGLIWDISVYYDIAPTHEAITEFEALLAEQAAQLGGRNDGWGSFAQP